MSLIGDHIDVSIEQSDLFFCRESFMFTDSLLSVDDLSMQVRLIYYITVHDS